MTVKVTPEEWGAFWKSREHLGREVVSAKPMFWREHSSPCVATVQREMGGRAPEGSREAGRGPTVDLGIILRTTGSHYRILSRRVT